MSNAKVTCPCCKVVMVRRRNPIGGGIFLGCPQFELAGCKVSYSPTEGTWSGLPGELTKASKHRGRVTSFREQIIVRLTVFLKCPRSEAEELLDRDGLLAAQELLATAA